LIQENVIFGLPFTVQFYPCLFLPVNETAIKYSEACLPLITILPKIRELNEEALRYV
jgi:hypothetical protein